MSKIACFVLFLLLGNFSYAQKVWSLRECIDYAMKNNLQVIQNQYDKDVQQKNYEIAKKGYLPTVDGNISNNANFGQNVSSTGLINRTDNFNNSASVGANILVYNNRRIDKQARKAGYDVEASMYDLQTTQNNISVQITQQYLNVLLNREITAINKSAMQNAQEVYNRAIKTTEAGTTAMTVQYEAEASLAREKQNYENARIETDRALFLLAQLLRLPNYKTFDIENYVIKSVDAPLNSDEDILEKAYVIQPQVKGAESRIKSAQEQVSVTKTAYWPTVNGTAGIGTSYYKALHNNYPQSVKEPQFFKQYKDNFSQQLGLSAYIPIFNKGITKLQVEQAKINENIAKNNLELQKQTIKENVQKASFDVNANYERYLAAEENEKSANLALDFAKKSYEAGKTTIYDYNIARNNYINAQGSVSQAKYNYFFSQKLLNFYAGIPLYTDY